MDHNKIIMIVGAGILQAPAIKTAREMGLLTLVTDMNRDAYGMRFADFPVVMSTRDVDGTVRVAKEFTKKRPINGVITVGTDASLTVAAVQHALDLPGNRIDVAEATTNKIKMRERLEKNKIPQPVFYPCWSYDDVTESSKMLGFPFVIKPADNMGARGVMRVNNTEMLRFAYERAKNASPRGEIITETFMEGPELSIDALVWEGEIYITGVADRIIEYPPYFVETGHIMPTNLPERQVKNAVEVFKKAVRALGIETGAAKGDIKVTAEGAKVGEIASRLSGGFMSAYTYPYSTGVNLIAAAIDIAIGKPPGDLTVKYHRVAVERAIIPGSGTVREIDGIYDALSLENVKNVFVTCEKGDTVHIPTNNVEKCGNVIAVADNREEALRDANIGIKLVKITLGDEGELNEGLIKKQALAKLSGACSVCKRCDGRECAGWLPGIGSVGAGHGFQRNIAALERFTILPDLLQRMDNTHTGSNIFGIPLDLPVLPAPISHMRRNLNGVLKEDEYNSILLKGSKKAGTIGCIAQKEYADAENDTSCLTGPLNEVYGHGIPFLNPYCGERTTVGFIEESFAAGVKVCGLSLDLKRSGDPALVDDRWLTQIVTRSPVPIIVKGVLTVRNAKAAVDAGVKGIVLSNRGGRVLESLPSGLEVLEEVREACGDELLIIVDGGIRNGEDVFKALSRGADLVMIGRPVLIALAGGNQDGVSFYINRIKNEFRSAMVAAGAKTAKDITKDMTKIGSPLLI